MPQQTTPIIEAKDLHKAYGKKANDYEALRGLGSTISQGESIAITGKSGSGKSTLIHVMSVLERTQEIGLLKALGMRKRGITFVYLVEAASIGFWGGLIGVVLAFLLGLIANLILNHTLFKGISATHILTYPLPYMLAIVVAAMIIGLLAGPLPAVRAGRLDPIEALRRE